MKFRKIITDAQHEWVVLLHGLGGESQLFYKQLEALTPHYNLFLINLPGHGGSDGLAEKYYTAGDMVEAIEALLLKEQIPKAHFLTFSLGTIIGNELLHAKAHLLRTMILIGPVLKFKRWTKSLIETAWFFRNLAPYMLFYQMFAYLIMPKKGHQKSRFYFVQEATKLGRGEFIKWVYLLKKARLPYESARKGEVAIKKLYLIGKEDHLFLEEAVVASKKDPHAELVVLDGCGHVCIIEKPVESNQVILQFLKKHSI